MKKNVIRLLLFGLLLSVLTVSAAKKKPKMEKQPMIGDKPAISRIEPRGIERGLETKIKLVGTNLIGLTEVKFSNSKLKGKIVADHEKQTEAWIKIKTDSDLARGDYEISVKNEKSESGKVKLYVDDLPQVIENATNTVNRLQNLPVTFWGVLDPMVDRDDVAFEAKRGQTIVFDVAAKSIGSKANLTISLFDAKGKMVASNDGFEGNDPLLVHNFATGGHYTLRVSEETLAGSPDHFYRLSYLETCFATAGFARLVEINLPSAAL